MQSYFPRRMPKRYLEGAPAAVYDIFDHPAFGDRYTVFCAPFHVTRAHEIADGPDAFHNTHFWYLGASAHPTHPQGIGMWGEMSAFELSRYKDAERRRRIKWADLPEAVRQSVRAGLVTESGRACHAQG